MPPAILATTLARLGALAALLIATPAVSIAQSADSLPFRKGQWGAEFSASDFGSIGALRFTSAKSAWLLDAVGRISRENGDGATLLYPGGSIHSDDVRLRAGWRQYAALAPRVVRHAGAGLLVSRNSYRREFVSTASPEYSAVTTRVSELVGLFGEIGAQWMLTRNLSLGASWSVTGLTGRVNIEEPLSPLPGSNTPTQARVRRTVWSAESSPIAIRGALYF